MRPQLEACNTKWQQAHVPEQSLVVDGPTLLKIGPPTDGLTYAHAALADTIGSFAQNHGMWGRGILVAAEMVEGTKYDTTKKYCGKRQKTTATTLWITKPWVGSSNVVCSDAWFGSS